MKRPSPSRFMPIARVLRCSHRCKTGVDLSDSPLLRQNHSHGQANEHGSTQAHKFRACQANQHLIKRVISRDGSMRLAWTDRCHHLSGFIHSFGWCHGILRAPHLLLTLDVLVELCMIIEPVCMLHGLVRGNLKRSRCQCAIS